MNQQNGTSGVRKRRSDGSTRGALSEVSFRGAVSGRPLVEDCIMKKIATIIRRGVRLDYYTDPKPVTPQTKAVQALREAARKGRKS